jgi:hypothetical protein
MTLNSGVLRLLGLGLAGALLVPAGGSASTALPGPSYTHVSPTTAPTGGGVGQRPADVDLSPDSGVRPAPADADLSLGARFEPVGFEPVGARSGEGWSGSRGDAGIGSNWADHTWKGARWGGDPWSDRSRTGPRWVGARWSATRWSDRVRR